jgi:cytochrome c oxidase subunit 2
MTLQNGIWLIALVGIGLLGLGFILIIAQAKTPADDAARRKSAHTSHVLQAWAFGVLLVVFVIGSWATLHKLPIPPQHQALNAKQVVDVVGHQWFWQIKPATLQAGSVVEFRVTSADVNHGFAIYAPDGRIVTQTQAMPGYTNKLLYTFDQPGTYTVQCLEYCGVGHAPMHAKLTVVAANSVAAAAQTPAGGAPAQTASAAGHGPVNGAQVFSANCAACHQAGGQGMPGVFPPLKGNSVVNDADPTKQIHVVLHGLQGEVVGGTKYAAAMPPFKDILSDEQIAAVINHERSSWGNHGKPVTAAQVAAARGAAK